MEQAEYIKNTMSQKNYISKNLNMSIEDVLRYAAEHITGDEAWMLAESPRKLLWKKWNGEYDAKALDECLKLFIFDGKTEIRLQRAFGQEKGFCRIIEEDASAPLSYVRFSQYLLADGKGYLKYAEHFKFDPQTGTLNLEFGRYCGVKR